MKALKIIAILFGVYVGVVVAFESLLGYVQPAGGSTQVITTFDADGTAYPRVVARLEVDGKLYVAANHWPRAWYNRALENPKIEVTYSDVTTEYRAVKIEGAEHDRVNSERPLGIVIKLLTGFPPRYFVRLDPVS